MGEFAHWGIVERRYSWAMRVEVRLFGPERAAAGRDTVAVDLAESATAGDVLAAVGEACPGLSLAAARLAVNHEFAEPARAIASGDEVALIGLVSGG